MMALTLALTEHPARDAKTAPALLIAHGLFGSARNWGAIAKRLSANRHVIAVDMRNHGQSPHVAVMTYPAMAEDLAKVIERHTDGPMDVLGHSMGGKAAMMLALQFPHLIDRLIVADIAPVRYAHSHAGHIAAMQRLDLGTITRRSDADAHLQDDVSEAAIRAFLLQSLTITPDGPRWLLNLDVLDAAMPNLVGWPEVDARFSNPALFLSGGASDYVLTEHHSAIERLFSNPTYEVIPHVGHWLHAEAPAPFIDAVSRFLTR